MNSFFRNVNNLELLKQSLYREFLKHVKYKDEVKNMNTIVVVRVPKKNKKNMLRSVLSLFMIIK